METCIEIYKIGLVVYLIVGTLEMLFRKRLQDEIDATTHEFGPIIAILIAIVAIILIALAWPYVIVWSVVNKFRKADSLDG